VKRRLRTVPLDPTAIAFAAIASLLVVAVAAGAWTGRVAAPAPAPVHLEPRAHDARLPAVVARLNRARAHGRAALERARTRSAQASLLRGLGEAHREAAASLRPAADAGALTRTLLSTARAYEALASAARDESPIRFNRARRRIRDAETSLASALDDARRPRAARAVRSAPAPDATDPARLLVVLIVLAISASAGLAVSPLANRPLALTRELASRTGRLRAAARRAGRA
jgi:hypothetical protein